MKRRSLFAMLIGLILGPKIPAISVAPILVSLESVEKCGGDLAMAQRAAIKCVSGKERMTPEEIAEFDEKWGPPPENSEIRYHVWYPNPPVHNLRELAERMRNDPP